MASTRLDNSRVIRADRGTKLSALSWSTEAPLRMLMNNLDPEVAEKPQELTVYGGIGRAARNWECFDAIVATLRRLKTDSNPLLLHVNMEAGHGGKSGRFERLKQVAREQAFFVDLAGAGPR